MPRPIVDENSSPLATLSADLSAEDFIKTLKAGVSGHFMVEGKGVVYLDGRPEMARLLLLHGAGAGQLSFPMRQFATQMAACHIQVVGVELGYMVEMQRLGKRRPPPPIARLQAEATAWLTLLGAVGDDLPLWVGGKSMGGRIASLLAVDSPVAGCVIFGYPFHPPRRPERTRLAHWPDVKVPALIVQGERDPFGNRGEVAEYRLPQHVMVHWLADGDHDFKPRLASGLTQQTLLAMAVQQAVDFMRTSTRPLP